MPAASAQATSATLPAPTGAATGYTADMNLHLGSNGNSTAAIRNDKNLQRFTKILCGAPITVAQNTTTNSRPFSVAGGGDIFVDVDTALSRTCDVQHNVCADAANIGQCLQQTDTLGIFLLLTSMATSASAVKALTWGAIGANLYVFGRWHIVPYKQDPKETASANNKQHQQEPTSSSSPAYREVQARTERYMRDNYTLSKRNIDEGRWYTVLTSAFSHQNLPHLAINMFMLREASMIASHVGVGPGRLAALALGSALGGSAGSLYDSTRRVQNGEPDVPGLGASGMVQGMLVATMLAAPRLPMQVMFIPIEISYRNVVGGFIAWDLYNLYQERAAGQRKESWTGSGSYIGYAAHLGGGAFGAVFYLLAIRRGRRLPSRFR
ncbi:hypothetical protein M406DRAFT_352435 [Cryphonectria parasitica EP155]|uniref:Peptidase S54 rhomboid domain-containing protein n=1 Tax=Cryphonectria parasitica (strain ATCC 38755 / EP155) TaxID=660469 RepID=A0A9P5CN27_CRYP1|nr:uncharacterized protein M406DRAFT_352435 [Cryphonectria parasitica EP155]KAF3763686.1 hypothetical protein M406DRAFT_352435 [Cryphonectria parasitica EP155]